jgi:hypothetical protein
MGDAVWRSRLRWRWRGAHLWPAFAVVLVADAVLLERLPIAGDRGPGIVGALLLAGFLNLIVVAVGAPLAGHWLRRRRPETPRVVADDRAGTALLLAGAAMVLALGIAHHPAVRDASRAAAAQAEQARRFVLSQAPHAYAVNIDRLETQKQGPNLYRTCVPGPDPTRSFCVFVNTDQSPPGVTRDPDQRPNATVSGPDNPGRK